MIDEDLYTPPDDDPPGDSEEEDVAPGAGDGQGDRDGASEGTGNELQDHDTSAVTLAGDELAQPLAKVYAKVTAEGGEATAMVTKVHGLDEHGTLSVIGAKHQLQGTEKGDYVDVELADGGHVWARVSHIHDEHDTFRAEIDQHQAAHWERAAIDPFTVEALKDNLGLDDAFRGVKFGTEVKFEQHGGVPHTLLREGQLGGVDDPERGLLALTGTEGGPGSSGSPVFSGKGEFVGMVVAYDPVQHVNLIQSADRVLADLRDFAHGVNSEDQASPVSYGDKAMPVTSDSELASLRAKAASEEKAAYDRGQAAYDAKLRAWYAKNTC